MPPFEAMSATIESSSARGRKCSGFELRLKPKLLSMPRTHSHGSRRMSSNDMYSGVRMSPTGLSGGTSPP